jgi:energy-coupling factor transporter transmembrane protein EcfT
MLERFRATKYANNYEHEGVRFGIYSVLIIVSCGQIKLPTKIFLHLIPVQYLVVSLMIGTILFLVFADDAGYNFFKMLPVNTVTNKVSNILYQVYTGFFILLVILTAIGDIWLYRKNKELMAARNAATKDQQTPLAPEYNLSQKYQLRENYTAMRFILPLDITYMLFIFISNILVIVLRSWEMPMAAFLAHYNFVNSVSVIRHLLVFFTFSPFPSQLMVIYAIISLLLYWRFLHAHEFWRDLQNPKGKIVPLEELGQAYFEQLKHQWN